MLESPFNKVAGLRPATLLKRRLQHRYFPVNFVKFLRTPFSQNTSGRLLLFSVHVINLIFGKWIVSKFLQGMAIYLYYEKELL